MSIWRIFRGRTLSPVSACSASMAIDLNADLGEGVGVGLGDDAALLGSGHERQRRLRLPRRRPGDHAPRGRAGGGDAAWRSAPRSATATSPGFGRASDRRRAPASSTDDVAVPARRAGGLRARGRRRACATSSRTARSTTRWSSDAGTRGGRRRRRCARSTRLPIARAAGLGAARAAEAAGLAAVGRGLRRPRLRAGRHADPARAAGALLEDEAAIERQVVERPAGRSGRSACTATRRAPSPPRSTLRAALERAGVAIEAFA